MHGDGQNRAIFEEALFLASPEFYDEWQKAGSLTPKEQLRLDISLYKYSSRAGSRCTPFGLFAGCSVGCWGERDEIELPEPKAYRRCTRLDMNYLCAVIQHLEQQPEIKTALRYYPNDSIYELGGRLRYVEYYFKKTKRVHRISSVEDTPYIQQALRAAGPGATWRVIAQSIVDEDISLDEALSFIKEMVEAQLLKSELEAAVTGEDPLSVLLQKLNGLGACTASYREPLARIQTWLRAIDAQPVGSTLGIYHDIIEEVKGMGVAFEPKFLFQTDLFKPTPGAQLDDALTDDLYGLLGFLNRMNPRMRTESNLSRFKEAFYARYEEAELPLMQVLDNELGLGYPVQEGNTGDINPLVDDLVLPGRGGAPMPQTFTKSANEDLLRRKYSEAVRTGGRSIELTNGDISGKEPDWSDLPATVSMICSMTAEAVYVKGLGGASAGNLLGRFCHLDTSLLDLTRAITKQEQALHPGQILAEIVHLPEARIGNILSRPVLREYEIPYLARPGVATEWQVALADLALSVRNGRLVLRSVSRNVEVVPRLTTAHNFSNNAMPVYRFLCELQSQECRIGLGFRWGEWGDSFDWLPRVTYGNFILSRELWRIPSEELKNLSSGDDSELLQKAGELCSRRGIPRWAVVPDGDNELLVDMQDALSLRAMLAHVHKRTTVTMEEFLFDPSATENGITPKYTNEFIFSFYRNPESSQV